MSFDFLMIQNLSERVSDSLLLFVRKISRSIESHVVIQKIKSK